ncbi:rho guanine nucleotide exchange factor 28 isoform X2 [Megalops cyprinoides]|uniref:rho guanine nucleotide exchange factor 28 isoform X2 n=1 Tax=Megalops cyprinoides TaxID=118141 RepID=UPI0018644F9F|nr:rho guanine nucleotide exchange factor 28 isoform X2 [Megalops cyprinoides]
MELSKREVPLYGQVKASVVLQTPEPDPEKAEFYIVLEGSALGYITAAQREGEGCALHFTVPGHNTLEMVSVTVCLYIDGGPVSCVGRTSLEYVLDDAQELADFLVSNSHCLRISSYQDILGRFGLSDEATRSKMDENVTKALANMALPCTWNVLGSQPGEELHPRETMLHLAVRLGLPRLSELLLCQPGGVTALGLSNEEGDTPLQLARQSGEQAMLDCLTTPPNSPVVPCVRMSQVWANSSSLLRFCHSSDTLTLVFGRGSDQNHESNILLLRKHQRDENSQRETKALKRSGLLNECKREDSEGDTDNKDLCMDFCRGDHALVDNVFEEELVLSLDEEEEDAAAFPSEKSQTASFGRRLPRSTFSAAARLSTMLNGKDQIYANSMLVDQVTDMDIKYSIAGVTGDSTQTESGDPAAQLWEAGVPRVRLSPLQAEGSGTGEEFTPTSQSPGRSPADLALARLIRSSRTSTSVQAASPPRESCTLSPSLVALEVDSEEDDLLEKSPLSQHSTSPRSGGVLQASSGDERDSFNTSPDLSGSRTHSTSSSCSQAPAKDLADSGIRLRSYSYSSPKISLVRPRFARDAAISDLSEEQRAFSLPEPPQEKRELSFRKRAQSAEDEGSVALADSLQHLTLSEFLKEIEEEEWDRYIIPSKAESEKYKVSRTFSFLKSRMSSTRNKNKGKGKDKEGKEKTMNGHQFTAGSGTALMLCIVCDKPAVAKDLLHCSNCTMHVHKGCRDSATPCMKKLQDKYAVMTKSRAASLPQSTTVRESPTGFPIPTSASLPVMTSRERREQACLPNSLSKSVPAVSERRFSEGLGVDPEANVWRNRSHSEELLQVMESSPSTDSSINEDAVDAPLRNDLSADFLDYEAESWSLAVDDKFCKNQEKRVIKRQDVIYELMQTEMHHIQTLTIMAEIFRKGMKEELLLDQDTVDKVFPCLDELFDFHKSFFCSMKERRQSCTQEDNDRNFLIDRIGDILVQQFSNENAEKMKQVYGEFCSHHTEAVNFFKELQQQNKKFQVFIKQQSNNSLVRRREIPECILLVTQRITKYPVLLERILQHSQEGTEEHADLSRALVLIRDVIAAVDLRVSEYEKEQKLMDILNRMENKSFAKLKSGHTFRKKDLLSRARTLKHEGLVYWKTATGRLKDILALLLTDTLIFLQEKDQKYIFAAVDQKPPVISLQKLIVREVANEERGMFLISASVAGPEMYEVHTASKEERNSWMRLIREAVESCPEEEEENASESEEDRRAAEARAQRIQKAQETLNVQDQQICSSLEEKLKIYAQLAGLTGREEPTPEPRLLVRPNPDEVPQAAVLLAAALREAEKLTTTLTSQSYPYPCVSQESLGEPSSPVKPTDTGSFSSVQGSPTDSNYLNTQSSSSAVVTSDLETGQEEPMGTDALMLESLTELRSGDASSINLKVFQSVQSLTQLLYSLQAAVTIQDSCYEVQRLLLQKSERQPRPPCPRANALQEQEKQRNLEKRREELAGVLRLQGQLRQEQQRWERECGARQRQQGELEGRLERRERECRLEAQRLRREREELDGQLREYQQSLERLREGQRLVERERQRLETQQRLLQSWRHSRQRSLPVMMIPLGRTQDSSQGRSGSLEEDGSVYINEAALQTSRNNRHLHQHQHHRSGSLALYPDTPSAHNSLNALMARGEGKQPSHLLPTQNHSRQTGTSALPLSEDMGGRAGGHGWDQTKNDVNTHDYKPDKWSLGAAMSRAESYRGFTQSPAGSPLLHPQTYISMETENGEDGGEENIVYL